MICRMPLFCLRMAVTLLVVMGLMASAQAKPAMPFVGSLMAVVICHDNQALTIWLDEDGNEHPAPHDCRDCEVCNVNPPVLPVFTSEPQTQTHVQRMAAVSVNTPGGVLPDYLIPPLRGPPTLHNRIASA